jgi:hypothetical protein
MPTEAILHHARSGGARPDDESLGATPQTRWQAKKSCLIYGTDLWFYLHQSRPPSAFFCVCRPKWKSSEIQSFAVVARPFHHYRSPGRHDESHLISRGD